MKMKHSMIFVIAVSLLVSGCQNPLSKTPVIGIIKNLSGSIKYYPGGSEEFIKLRTADINDRPLFPMDMLELDKNSFLHLHFYDHGDAFLGNQKTETKLIIRKPSSNTKFQVITELRQGVMDCFIEKKGSRFAVQTPVAVAGVLGTLFKVSVDDQRTMVTMIEGKNGIEIQNLKQSLKEPKILDSIQRIEIIHNLVDHETLTDLPSAADEIMSLSNVNDMVMPAMTKVSANEDSPMESVDIENQLIPMKISVFESPLEFKYPVGVNSKGQLEFKSYLEYEGNHRIKTYSK